MTIGQLLFCAGAALLGITVILIIIFIIKKPKYCPENAVTGSGGQTVPLRNGYPTEPMTIRYNIADKKNNKDGEQDIETAGITEKIDALAAGTERLSVDTELLSPETELLTQETQRISEETIILK